MRETADNVEMQGIEFQIVNDSAAAARGLDELAKKLSALKTATSGASTSLSKVASGISAIKNALNGMNTGDFTSKMNRISAALGNLKTQTENLKISSTIGKQLAEINSAVNAIPDDPSGKLNNLASGLRPLAALGRAQLTSFISQLKKLPELITDLESADIDKFSDQMNDLASAIRPLADEMNRVAAGFSALPSRIRNAVSAIDAYNSTANKATTHSGRLGNAFNRLFSLATVKRLGKLLGQAISKASEYTETLNLFAVSMGKYGEEAYNYAQKVSEIMGIDPAEWMQNQGVFNTIITGFGVAGDKAAVMSKNLTQLGYDLASFYNIDFESAMQKVQSGISGELEPLRRLGYDLSVARLEQERLNLGIEKSVSDMTQAEKSQLRYYTMMNQVTQVQGDMARTLENPANQLRVLKAEFEQAARSLGNLFIPALTNALPNLIAFGRVLRDIGNEIAAVFNITLPEVDWGSSISTEFSTAADAAGDIEDNLSGAAGAAKELKKYIAGFDELNVLPSESLGGGGGSGSTSIGDGFNIPIKGYDFLGDAVNKKVDLIYSKLKKIITPVKKIVEFLQKYQTIIKAAAGAIAIGVLIKKLGELKAVAAVFGFIKTAIKSFKELGVGAFKLLGEKVLTFRENLTGIQKTAIVAAAAFAEFYVVRNNMKELALGCENTAEKVVQIGLVAGAAAAAMAFALGPAGVAVAALTGLTAAIVGVSAAEKEMLNQISDDAFYSGTGVKISDLADSYENLMQRIVDTNEPILEGKARIDSARESISKTSNEIGTILTAFKEGYTPTAEEIAKLESLFAELKTAASTEMNATKDVIVTAIAGGFGDALEAAGRSSAEILAVIQTISGEYDMSLSEISAKMNELTAAYNSGTLTMAQYIEQADPLIAKLREMTGESDETADAFSGVWASLGNVDWESEESYSAFFDSITESTVNAKTSINDSADSLEKAFTKMKNATDDVSLKKVLDDAIRITNEDRERQLGNVDEQLTALYDGIQKDIVKKTGAVQEKASDEWDNMSWLSKAFNKDTAETFVQKAIRNYQNNVVAKIEGEIESSMEKTGTSGSVWAGDAMSQILQSLFDVSPNYETDGLSHFTTTYNMEIDEAISDALDRVAEEGKTNAKEAGSQITKGLGTGISDELKFAESASIGVVNGIDEAIRGAAEIHSPSKRFARDGVFMVDGLVSGWKERMDAVKSSFIASVKGLFSESEARSIGNTYGTALADGISKALRNASFPSIRGSASTSGGSSRISFGAYAAGGFPDSGQFFMARENGVPEMVGSIGNRAAVANNDQIVEAVKSGVYEAVVAAFNASGRGSSGQPQIVSAKVNGKTLFDFVVGYARDEAVRTGENPLLEL